MIWILLLISCLSVLQLKSCDKMACLIFSFPAIVVYCFGEYIPGFLYFHVCGFIDLLTVFLILKVRSNLSFPLSCTLFISIILNLFGFVIWYNYLSSNLYTMPFLAYYSFVAYLLLSRGKIDWNYWGRFFGSSQFSSALGRG